MSCHQDTATASQGDLREAPGRPITVLGKGPSLCSEPGMQQGRRLVRRTHSGAMWAEVHPLFSLSCVLETLTSAFEHKQLMAYVCVCVLSTPTNGFAGDHPATTVTIPLRQLSLHIGRARRGRNHLWFAGSRSSVFIFLCREHGNGSAFGLQGSAMGLPLYLCNIYQQPSFILLFPAFHFFKTNNSRPFVFTMEHDHQEISQGKKKTQ